MDSFSRRQGLVPETVIQIDSMDAALRNSLWNALNMCFWSKREIPHAPRVVGLRGDYFGEQPLRRVIVKLWAHHFRWLLDSMPQAYRDVVAKLREQYTTLEWYEVYDFIEFMAPLADEVKAGSTSVYIERCNMALERECSAYRFVGTQICRITNNQEIAEIESALQTPFETIQTQIQSALDKLSDREESDYRNSIKESISAVETVVNLINGTNNKSLGDALKKISDAIDLHPALAKGLDSIYGYTCDDKGGIRHAMMEKTDLRVADARFMLVSCSAFVNYLIAKAEQANIPLGS